MTARLWICPLVTGLLTSLTCPLQSLSQTAPPPEATQPHLPDSTRKLAPADEPAPKRIPPQSPVVGRTRPYSIQQALNGAPPQLEPAEIAAYLTAHPNNPDSALGVFRLGKDLHFLKKSALQFPAHAPLQMEQFRYSETLEEKSAALLAFRNADPRNAFGPYLAALQHMQNGRNQEVISELVSAEALRAFSTDAIHSSQAVEDAYRLAGFSPAISKISARSTIPSDATLLWQIFDTMSDLASYFQQEGDEQGVVVTKGMQQDFAQRLQTSPRFSENMLGFLMADRLASAPDFRRYSGRREAAEILLTEMQKWRATANEADALLLFRLTEEKDEIEAMRQTFQK